MELIEKQAAMDCCFKPQVRPNAEIFNALKMAISSEISALQSIPAVPLDKLCEWLAGNAFAFECKDCEEYCRALLECENEVGGDPEYWKNKLTEWMEGLEDDKAD